MKASMLAAIRGILIHVTSCFTKTRFIYGLLQGGGANLNSLARKAYGQMVYAIYNYGKNQFIIFIHICYLQQSGFIF